MQWQKENHHLASENGKAVCYSLRRTFFFLFFQLLHRNVLPKSCTTGWIHSAGHLQASWCHLPQKKSKRGSRATNSWEQEEYTKETSAFVCFVTVLLEMRHLPLAATRDTLARKSSRLIRISYFFLHSYIMLYSLQPNGRTRFTTVKPRRFQESCG